MDCSGCVLSAGKFITVPQKVQVRFNVNDSIAAAFPLIKIYGIF